MLNIVNEIEPLASVDRTTEDIKKEFPDEIEKLEEALNNYISENDLKILGTEFLDKKNFLTKHLAYPFEYFNSVDDFKIPADNVKKKTSSIN